MSTVLTRQSPLDYQKRYKIDDAVPRENPPVQTGVRVAGGTQNGDYTKRGQTNGKDYFNLTGHPDDATGAFSVYWILDIQDASPTGVPTGSAWLISDSIGNLLYYSLSQVLLPDLGSNWKKGVDDTSAPITVVPILI